MTDKLRARSYTDTPAYSFRDIILSIYRTNINIELNRPWTCRKEHISELHFTVHVP
jgi:hypothetical protein